MNRENAMFNMLNPEQGRRPELVGGGLTRSLGGWKAVKNARFSGQDRMKSDHRILGDSAFVMEVLAEAEARGLYCYWAVVELGY